jgi:hypothetical protein
MGELKMPNPIDLEKLLADNPGINAAQLKEWLELSQKLRAAGATRYKYNLLSPFARRPRHAASEVVDNMIAVRSKS